MRSTTNRLELTRNQILAFRRRVGALDERLPPGADSLHRAAWAGLQDSMPRAAVLSIHARVEGALPSSWEDPTFVQIWGPRYNAYVIAAQDLAVFTLGRLPDNPAARRSASDLADRLETALAGRRLPYTEAGRLLAGHGRALGYAAPTGRVLIRWEGARRPLIWTGPPPDVAPRDARLELARRYLHIFGPTTPESLAGWAGIPTRGAIAAFEALRGELTPVRTPIGDAWMLSTDEPTFRAPPPPPAPARLLPSGDAYFLLWGIDRELLVPDPGNRAALWTSRVWPGAVLADGDIVGTWRRSQALVTVSPWRSLSADQREAIETEASTLPLPGLAAPIKVRWE